MEYFLVFLLVCGAAADSMIGIIDEAWDVMSLTMKQTRPNGVQVHDSADTIELHCQAKQADMVHWTYPANKSDSTHHGEANIVTRPVSDTMEVSVLTISNATHEDTGKYECFCSGMLDLEHSILHSGSQLIGRRSVYIFVRDEEHLLKGSSGDGRMPILASARESLTIPCISTDPEATVSLHRDGHPYELSPPVTVDNSRVYYDDRYGFRIEGVMFRDGGGYSCIATKANVTDVRNYFVRIESNRPVVMYPVITARSRVVHPGTSAFLKCQVAVGRNQLTQIKWYKKAEGSDTEVSPENDPDIHTELSLRDELCSGHRESCSFRHRSFRGTPALNLYRTVISRLRLDSISVEDSGEYYCDVISGSSQRASNSVNIFVPDQSWLLAENYNSLPLGSL